VLRCLKCLHGTELPDITPAGRQKRLTKNLVVKADEKTRAFLDEFEELNLRTDVSPPFPFAATGADPAQHDDELDASAKTRIGNIVRALHDPSADLAAVIGQSAAPDVKEEDKHQDLYVVPDHLKDLDASELPENQRSVVMGQIASFREASAKREAEKRRHDENLDVRKQAMMGSSVPYGRTPYQGPPPARNWASPGSGASASPVPQQQQPRPMGDGPQGYHQPVGFVKAQTVQGKAVEERTDEEVEQMRVAEQQRQKANMLREVRCAACFSELRLITSGAEGAQDRGQGTSADPAARTGAGHLAARCRDGERGARGDEEGSGAVR
jgi:RNA-binding protein 25